MEIIDEIKKQINDNDIILFMKGTPEMPQCGFSMQTSQALQACNAQFAYVDILANPDIRENLPKVSKLANIPSGLRKGRIDRWMRYCFRSVSKR